MRRFVTLAVVIFFALPFGISLTGCHHAVTPTYCNGQTSGVQVGQLTSLDLEPKLTGISLNQGEIGRVSSPSGKDCRGNSASASGVVYASTNIQIADVDPSTGSLCGGSWNRNTNYIADYTVCTPTATPGVAFITASSEGVVSNPIPVFIHPTVTSIVLGPASTNCTTDPASNCIDLNQNTGCDTGTIVAGSGSLTLSQTALSGGVATYTFSAATGEAPTVGQQVTITGTKNGGGILNVANAVVASLSGTTSGTFTIAGFSSATTLPATPDTGQAVIIIPVYDGLECISQGITRQLVARSYANNSTSPANNISCQVGPLQFNALNGSAVTIDANGVATAAQPGSSTITASISQASSNAGFFSTCPPRSIVLSVPPSTSAPTAPISVNQNTAQPLVATVTDTNGNPINNLQLEFESTEPTIIPAGGNTITPTYAGTAAITAICQPPTCNSAPFNEIGLFGNGSPVTSNPVNISAAGTNFSTVLYMASRASQYIQPVDFTVTTQPSATRLPYAPNSMVLSEDLSTIYMGTSVEIMVFSTASNALIRQDNSISGTVLAVSPDNGTVIITDPVRQLVYLYGSSGSVSTEYGGVANSASFSPDSSTVYITTTDGRLLVHSTYTGWSSIPLTTPATGAAITVPNAGAYLASSPVDVRTNCPASTISGTGLNQTTVATFYPDLGPVAGVNATVDTATNDGLHILTAYTPTAGGPATFTDIRTNTKSGGCPVTFTSTPGTPLPLTGITVTTNPTNLTGTNPYGLGGVVATSDSAFAFVPYTGTYSGTGGAAIPQYNVAAGTLSNVALQSTAANGTPIAPVAAVISSDNNTLYVSTSGDNVVHRLTRGANGFSENPTTLPPVVPALPGVNGGTATPDLIVQRPRKATS
jgi:hypothetical protein